MSSRINIPIILVLVIITISSCLPAPEPIVFPTPTSTITLTPSPTVIWFPPTATNTPRPTDEDEPTATLPPQVGTILFSENFRSSADWAIPLTSSGRITVESGELTITLIEPEGYLFTTRTGPDLQDFYLEVTLHPSLCTGEDQYGVLFRATPPSAFYRLGLSCDGRIRLDRIMGGTASSPQPWMRTASLSPGALTTSTVGILARGETFQVYINDDFQFEVNDPMLTSGVIGFFVRSANQTAMTVSMTDLVVYSATSVESNP